MKATKLRLLFRGGIISIIGAALLAVRGLEVSLGGLLLVGIVLLALGLLRKESDMANGDSKPLLWLRWGPPLIIG